MVQNKDLKEKHFDPTSFIGGWYIPETICDELIDYFNYNKKYVIPGTTGGAKGSTVNKDIKESFELSIGENNFDCFVGDYRFYLQEVLKNYLNKFESANAVAPFNIVESFNLQKYPKGGGFKNWHMELTGSRESVFRHLVFMTYLNNVEDGGTEFYYQKLSTKAEKGLTLIWPAGWTHTHRGIVSDTKEKYIVTGWYSFIRGEQND